MYWTCQLRIFVGACFLNGANYVEVSRSMCKEMLREAGRLEGPLHVDQMAVRCSDSTGGPLHIRIHYTNEYAQSHVDERSPHP